MPVKGIINYLLFISLKMYSFVVVSDQSITSWNIFLECRFGEKNSINLILSAVVLKFNLNVNCHYKYFMSSSWKSFIGIMSSLASETWL